MRKLTQLTVDDEQGCFAALAKLKRQNPHIETLLSVGGGSGSANFPAVAARFQGRESFARTTRELVERFALDLIDSKSPYTHSSSLLISRLPLEKTHGN